MLRFCFCLHSHPGREGVDTFSQAGKPGLGQGRRHLPKGTQIFFNGLIRGHSPVFPGFEAHTHHLTTQARNPWGFASLR